MQDWQVVSLVYSARKAGFKGPITRQAGVARCDCHGTRSRLLVGVSPRCPAPTSRLPPLPQLPQAADLQR